MTFEKNPVIPILICEDDWYVIMDALRDQARPLDLPEEKKIYLNLVRYIDQEIKKAKFQ